jgi:hypothetical protein
MSTIFRFPLFAHIFDILQEPVDMESFLIAVFQSSLDLRVGLNIPIQMETYPYLIITTELIVRYHD